MKICPLAEYYYEMKKRDRSFSKKRLCAEIGISVQCLIKHENNPGMRYQPTVVKRIWMCYNIAPELFGYDADYIRTL